MLNSDAVPTVHLPPPQTQAPDCQEAGHAVMTETPKRPRSAFAKRERQRILTEVLSPTVCPSPDIPDAVPVVALIETEDVYKVEPEWEGSLDTMEELVSPHTFRMDRSKCGVA